MLVAEAHSMRLLQGLQVDSSSLNAFLINFLVAFLLPNNLASAVGPGDRLCCLDNKVQDRCAAFAVLMGRY